MNEHAALFRDLELDLVGLDSPEALVLRFALDLFHFARDPPCNDARRIVFV